MAYNSLFDRLEKCLAVGTQRFFHNYSKNQAYTGTLKRVLDDLESSLESEENEQTILNLIFHPPRIMRAVVDYKIEAGTEHAENLVREATGLSLGIYRSEDGIEDKIRKFRESVQSKSPELLDRQLVQSVDGTTLSAMDPYRSRRTSEWMRRKTNGSPLFFVPLAHGAVATGMDVYLRYCDLTGTNSEFYPVRFSRQKSADREPRITRREKEYIMEKSADKEFLVVFEEDTISGTTLGNAAMFFLRNFPERKIFTAANLTYWDADGDF